VSRENWLPEGADRVVTEHDLGRLHDLTAKFDFSILCCPSLSWVAARIGRACEGLVLVLTANKTRRVVASKMREQLRSAQVPLLGTVLAERRFPIPAGVYRSL
jgi:Mrp family chromosome partitioning ATPase